MNTLVWVDPSAPLPSASSAPAGGLLAAGLDLSVGRLTEAYSKGIFPWFNDSDPVLWWSPDPRMVLTCTHLRISKSLAKRLRRIARIESDAQAAVRVTTNLAFDRVINACAAWAPQRESTWISTPIQQVYSAWHAAGHVHSIEVWQNGVLVGGLYGVCLGRFFFGESMFSNATDSSKIALVYLVRRLEKLGIAHIDCQQETPHLSSLGARAIPRQQFLGLLEQAVSLPTPDWGRGQVLCTGDIAAEVRRTS